MTVPTPPIGFSGAPAAVEGRLNDGPPVDEAAVAALRAACPDTVTDPALRAEASRDWWPLAMHWAIAGQVGGLADVVCRPADAGEVAAVLRVCHARSLPVTA
ncbi:MAG TPA: hypothetical protein VF076_02370, partial [Acidimicrobiales bacterium]